MRTALGMRSTTWMEDPLHGENDTQLPGFLAGDESSAIWGPGPDEGLARHCTQPGSETHCPAARPWSSTDSKDNVSLAVNHQIPPDSIPAWLPWPSPSGTRASHHQTLKDCQPLPRRSFPAQLRTMSQHGWRVHTASR